MPQPRTADKKKRAQQRKNTPAAVGKRIATQERKYEKLVGQMAEELAAMKQVRLDMEFALELARGRKPGEPGPVRGGGTPEGSTLESVRAKGELQLAEDTSEGAQKALLVHQGLVTELASQGASLEEIATVTGMTTMALVNHYGADIERGLTDMRISLRRAQLKQALNGSDRMLVFLGKVCLGQDESPGANKEQQEKAVIDLTEEELLRIAASGDSVEQAEDAEFEEIPAPIDVEE
jgi:hypothetical protein